MKVRRFLAFLCLSAVLLTACDQKTKEADPNVLAESDSAGAGSGDTKKMESTPTSIEFAEKEFDFGKINSGEMVSHVFTFKNTGNAPLIILDAKASCGCTVPQWTKEPVAPGQTGEIEVKYNGSGSGQVHKTVTVTANTEPKETVLEIKADVRSIDLNSKGPLKK